MGHGPTYDDHPTNWRGYVAVGASRGEVAHATRSGVVVATGGYPRVLNADGLLRRPFGCPTPPGGRRYVVVQSCEATTCRRTVHHILSWTPLEEGDRVERGDPVGIVGSHPCTGEWVHALALYVPDGERWVSAPRDEARAELRRAATGSDPEARPEDVPRSTSLGQTWEPTVAWAIPWPTCAVLPWSVPPPTLPPPPTEPRSIARGCPKLDTTVPVYPSAPPGHAPLVLPLPHATGLLATVDHARHASEDSAFTRHGLRPVYHPTGSVQHADGVRYDFTTALAGGHLGPGNPFREVAPGGYDLRSLDEHDGTDLVAHEGAPVLAATAGTVVAARRNAYEACPNGAGLTSSLVLEECVDLGCTRQVYGHLTETFVWPGREVEAGDVIGTIGSTACVVHPHLHFAVYLRSDEAWRPIDPIAWQGDGPDPLGDGPAWAFVDPTRPEPTTLGYACDMAWTSHLSAFEDLPVGDTGW